MKRNSEPTTTRHPDDPAAPAKPKRRTRDALAGLIVLGVIFGMGACTGSLGHDDAAPAATRTVERRVEVPGPVTTTVPAACLTALDKADEGFGYASDALGAAGDGFTAIADGDLAAAEDALDDINATNGDLEATAPQYTGARDECRATASTKGA